MTEDKPEYNLENPTRDWLKGYAIKDSRSDGMWIPANKFGFNLPSFLFGFGCCGILILLWLYIEDLLLK